MSDPHGACETSYSASVMPYELRMGVKNRFPVRQTPLTADLG